MSTKAVETLVTCQIFLSHNYPFDMEAGSAPNDTKKKQQKKNSRGKAAKELVDTSLQVSQLEVFDLYSRHRARLLRWFQGGGSQEAGGLGGMDLVAKTPDQLLEHVIHSLTSARSMGSSWSDKDGCARRWASLDYPGCVGRLCPDTEQKNFSNAVAGALTVVQAIKKADKRFEEWLKITTTQSVETEINLQIGTFTLKSNQAELLAPSFREFADFAKVFPTADRLQCTKVHSTEEREWVRIVALRHDLQLWIPTTRPHSGRFSVPYVRQGWLPEVLELVPLQLMGSLFVEVVDVSSVNVVRGSGVWEGCAKEFVISRVPPVALIFNIEEHGRRLYKRLVFSTDAARCFHHLTPMLQPSPNSTEIGAWAVSAGDAAAPSSLTEKKSSLVIRRNLSGKLGPQMFIPERLLHGILPDALLDDYTFWQDVKDAQLDGPSVLHGENTFYRATNTVLRGYKRPHAIARESGAPLDTIVVTCTPQGKGDPSGLGRSDAFGCVQRVLAVHEGEGVCMEIVPVDGKGVAEGGGGGSSLTLMNSAFLDPASPVGRVLETLLRLENLSHILIWGKSSSPDAVPTLERVELPRLRLSFIVEAAKSEGGGEGGGGGGVLMRSVEHDGLYISNARSAELETLLKGMPHAIVLQDSAGDLYILASAAACPYKGGDVGGSKKPELFSCALFLDRGNEEWLANLGEVRHYLYPVHISKRFVVLPSLPAALSLLLFKVLHRCYSDAARLAPSCISDTQLTDEEAQIWGKLELIADDQHPDAVGARLHISRATSASASSVPWSVATELGNYCRLLHKIRCDCRLSLEEEMLLLEEHGLATRQLRNRAAMLRLLLNSKPGEALKIKFEQPPARTATHFDEIEDRTCLEDKADGLKALLGAVELADYKPPEQVSFAP